MINGANPVSTGEMVNRCHSIYTGRPQNLWIKRVTTNAYVSRRYRLCQYRLRIERATALEILSCGSANLGQNDSMRPIRKEIRKL